VEFDDGAVDAWGEAEVVGVDEQHERTAYSVWRSAYRVQSLEFRV
jgi:hypothetical protein